VTSALLIARHLIILWVTVWVTPFEFTFDVIEAELHRRGVGLSDAFTIPKSWLKKFCADPSKLFSAF
jgi:hypothetical protein